MDPEDIKAKVVGWTRVREDRDLSLRRVRLQGEDFSGRRLNWFTAEACRFEKCRFDRLRITDSACFGAGYQQSEYIDCSFDRARIRYITGGNACFVRCSFRDVDLRD